MYHPVSKAFVFLPSTPLSQLAFVTCHLFGSRVLAWTHRYFEYADAACLTKMLLSNIKYI